MSASATPSARAEPESALPTVAMLLGGRYRLWERLAEQDGSTEWRATDEVLARTVAVRTFPPESRQAREVIAAARAAARVSDARLARVAHRGQGRRPGQGGHRRAGQAAPRSEIAPSADT
jgi:hypothetical protein